MKILRYTAVFGMVLGFLLPLASPARADDGADLPAKIAPDGHRFLFVVETSSNSRRLSAATRQAVFDLILSGLNGHMRHGDTYGVWTYNNEVHLDYPMAVWETNRSLELAGRAAAYLDKQKYSKKADLAKVVANLRLLSDRVGDFDVFIVSSGRDTMTGTPFDQKVNDAYELYGERPGKLAKLPLITTFVVRKGRPLRAFVSLPGDRIALPVRPPAPVPGPATNAPAALVATSPAPPPVNAAPRPKVIQIMTKTNPPPMARSQSTPVATASVSAPAPAPTSPLTASPATPVTTAQIENAPGRERLVAGAVESVSPLPANPFPILGEPENSEPAPATSSRVSDPSAPAPSAPSVQPAVASSPAAAATQPSASRMARASDGLGSPLVVAAREPGAAGVGQRAESGSGPGAKSPVVPVQAVAAVPAGGLSAGSLLAIGGVLFAAAGFLFFVALRRPGSGRNGSLITQSMGERTR